MVYHKLLWALCVCVCACACVHMNAVGLRAEENI